MSQDEKTPNAVIPQRDADVESRYNEKMEAHHLEHARMPPREPTDAELKAEKRVISKLDRIILPLTALMYLSAYLDRGNTGNARLQGLQEMLGGSDRKFEIVLMSFYITYIAFSIPGTLLAKATSPSMSIACGCLIWSVAASAMAGAQSFAGVVVCRLFIGLGEALFGQAVAFHYSIWYKKEELGKRLAAFIGFGVIAGAFGGLIAFGVSHIHSTLATWRILFLIEGIPSFVLAIIVFFCLPSRPATSKYITEDERAILFARMDRDGLNEKAGGLDWKAIRYALTDWKNLITAVCYSCMNCTLGSVSGFLPTIVKTMGYSNADAQLYTVPPYAVALATMLLINTASDRLRSRGLFVALVFSLSSIGWIILLTVVDNQRARYFATFLVVIGGYCAIPLIMSWTGNNTAYSESARAAALGLLNSVGQCLAIAASFLFPSADKPRWITGFSVNLGLNLLAVTIALSMTAYYRYENRRRDKAEGGPPAAPPTETSEHFDKTVGYRYTV